MTHYTLLAVLMLAMMAPLEDSAAVEKFSKSALYSSPRSGSQTVKISAAEERYLFLLRTVSFKSTYADIKRLVPEVGDLRAVTSFGDYSAGLKARLFGIPMTGAFNFHKEALVSHGFSAEGLDRKTALRVYRTIRDYLFRKAGKVREDKSGTDAGPGWFCNWSAGGIDFGVYWSKKYNGYSVGWGAQATTR